MPRWGVPRERLFDLLGDLIARGHRDGFCVATFRAARSSCRSPWSADPASRRTARRRATALPDTRPASRPLRPPLESHRPWPSRRFVMAGAGRTAPLSYCCLVPLPGRQTVRSRPRWSRRIRTRIAHGIVTATRGCSWNPLATGPSSEVSGFRTERHACTSPPAIAVRRTAVYPGICQAHVRAYTRRVPRAFPTRR